MNELINFRNAQDFENWLNSLDTSEKLRDGRAQLDQAISHMERQIEESDHARREGIAVDEAWYKRVTYALRQNKQNRNRVFDKLASLNAKKKAERSRQQIMLEELRKITPPHEWQRIVDHARRMEAGG